MLKQLNVCKVAVRSVCTTTTLPPPRNGKASKTVDEFIRVDHAGELGADRIYAGQMAILGKIYNKNRIFFRYIFSIKKTYRQWTNGSDHQTYVGSRASTSATIREINR